MTRLSSTDKLRAKTVVRVAISVGLSLCAALGSGCRHRAPHVVLVSIDTLNVNFTGPYNPEIDYTPNLDAFADEGVRFQHAYTSVPITVPSHASLMTGTPVRSHGVMANDEAVPLEVTTLAEIFKRRDYHTGGFISLGVLKKTARLHQGFDVFDDPFTRGSGRWYRHADAVLAAVREWLGNRPDKPFFLWVHLSDPHEPYLPVDAPPDTRLELDDEIIGEWSLAAKDQATLSLTIGPGHHRLRWISSREPRPDDLPSTGIQVMLQSTKELVRYASSPLGDDALVEVYLRPDWSVELFNPLEENVVVPLRFTGRIAHPPPSEVVPNYEHEVQYTDRHLGELRALIEETAGGADVVWTIVSDHGEGLYHHRAVGHATHVFEDQLRIVWLMQGPGLPRGQIIDETPAVGEDGAPTRVHHLGWEEHEDMEGRSMTGCWADGRCPRRETWWSYGLKHDGRRLTSIAGYRWPYKWLWRRNEGRRAHQLLEDPREEKNLLDAKGRERPPEVRTLAEDFKRVRRGLALQLRYSPPSAAHPENDELLRSLGYIGNLPAAAEPPY